MIPDYYDSSFYCHKSSGSIDWCDKAIGRWGPWWANIQCDWDIVAYYAWLLKRYGIPVHKGAISKAHISFVKGEKPLDMSNWGRDYGQIEFYYSHLLSHNDRGHVWLDVWCPQLQDIRADLGLAPFKGSNRHLTVGKLV